ncbi:MAG: type III-B CRISPR module RAMP protein Cmr4 [Acidobacteriota bacterium]|nr:type III-B CRISPR module RAMP protein Cmr4 [Acidobacteriota bacterium]
MTESGVVYLHCLTPLHNGAGQGLGSIDRPILREVTTRNPYVQSSTLKGALRAEAVARLKKAGETSPQANKALLALFGKGETDGNLGCLTLTDASVLLFPVRSLAGTFAWITSFLPLANFLRLRRLSFPTNALTQATSDLLASGLPSLGRGAACGSEGEAGGHSWNDTPLRLDGTGHYILEGLVLRPQNQAARQIVGRLAAELSLLLFPDVHWQSFFRERLLFLNGEDYSHLLLHATPIEANIKIEPTGVTADGSLRYTEFLPAETVLYSYFQIGPPGQQATPQEVGTLFQDAVGDLPQVGADESKGKGLVHAVVEPTRAAGAANAER